MNKQQKALDELLVKKTPEKVCPKVIAMKLWTMEGTALGFLHSKHLMSPKHIPSY